MKPVIGYTLGDQAGIGPEVVAAALSSGELPAEAEWARQIPFSRNPHHLPTGKKANVSEVQTRMLSKHGQIPWECDPHNKIHDHRQSDIACFLKEAGVYRFFLLFYNDIKIFLANKKFLQYPIARIHDYGYNDGRGEQNGRLYHL